MDKQQALDAIKKARENSGKRKFKQSFDLIINLKDVNLKKTEEQVELFVVLHYDKGKKTKICALVGPELLDQAKEACDLAISVDDFEKYQDKKVLKKLAKEYDYFIAQATIMPKVATAFGKVLGPRNKMPNPKAGCVVPPNANLRVLVARLQKQVRVVAKSSPVIYCVVGDEETKDEEIADNVLTIYSNLIPALPKEKLNIKNSYLKLTMGKNIKISEKEDEKKEAKVIRKRGILPGKKPEQEEELPKKDVKEAKKELPKKETGKTRKEQSDFSGSQKQRNFEGISSSRNTEKSAKQISGELRNSKREFLVSKKPEGFLRIPEMHSISKDAKHFSEPEVSVKEEKISKEKSKKEKSPKSKSK